MAELDVVDQLARYGAALERAVEPVTAADVAARRPADAVQLHAHRGRRRALVAAAVAAAAVIAVVLGIGRSDESSEVDVQQAPEVVDREGLDLDGLYAALPAPPEDEVWGVTFTDLELADELLGLTPPDPADRQALVEYQLALAGGPGPEGSNLRGVGSVLDFVATETSLVVVDPTVVGAVVSFDTVDLDAPYEASGVGTTLLGGALEVDAVVAEVQRLQLDAEVAIEKVDGGTRLTATDATGEVRLVAHVGDTFTVLADDGARVDAVLATAAGDAPSFLDDPARDEIVERLDAVAVAAGQISNRTYDAREWAEQRAPASCGPDCDAAALEQATVAIEAEAAAALVPPHEVWAIGGTISRDTATDQYPVGTPLVILLVTFDGPAPSLFDAVLPWIDGTAFDDAQDEGAAPGFDLIATSEKGSTSESVIVVEEPGTRQWFDLLFRIPLPLPSEGG